ncbi:hypothetical protein [Winogradskyella forsetii]|nr:hypothetical protein [Winogradskyella forsetii]
MKSIVDYILSSLLFGTFNTGQQFLSHGTETTDFVTMGLIA